MKSKQQQSKMHTPVCLPVRPSYLWETLLKLARNSLLETSEYTDVLNQVTSARRGTDLVNIHLCQIIRLHKAVGCTPSATGTLQKAAYLWFLAFIPVSLLNKSVFLPEIQCEKLSYRDWHFRFPLSQLWIKYPPKGWLLLTYGGTRGVF